MAPHPEDDENITFEYNYPIRLFSFPSRSPRLPSDRRCGGSDDVATVQTDACHTLLIHSLAPSLFLPLGVARSPACCDSGGVGGRFESSVDPRLWIGVEATRPAFRPLMVVVISVKCLPMETIGNSSNELENS